MPPNNQFQQLGQLLGVNISFQTHNLKSKKSICYQLVYPLIFHAMWNFQYLVLKKKTIATHLLGSINTELPQDDGKKKKKINPTNWKL